jgi:hypothetical protein
MRVCVDIMMMFDWCETKLTKLMLYVTVNC